MHFIGITAENSSLIATIGLFPKLHLASDSFADFQFQFIEVLNNPALVDEPAKPVRALTVRIMKVIPDVVSVICFALLSERIAVEVGNCHGVGV